MIFKYRTHKQAYELSVSHREKKRIFSLEYPRMAVYKVHSAKGTKPFQSLNNAFLLDLSSDESTR